MKWIDRDGHMFAPPLVVDGVEHHSPSSELLLRAGYHPYTPERKQKGQKWYGLNRSRRY